jgi:trehalose 6-phosphate synthase/phosphatase
MSNEAASSIDVTWKETVKNLMQEFVERTPGSFIENKGSAMVWQYRDVSDAEFGHWQAKELASALDDILRATNVDVTR